MDKFLIILLEIENAYRYKPLKLLDDSGSCAPTAKQKGEGNEPFALLAAMPKVCGLELIWQQQPKG